MMITPPELFNLLSDETRLRCLMLLHSEKELCVCELSSILKFIQPKISRHLALLRKSGIVSDERRGQWVYYRLSPALPQWAQTILRVHFDSLKELAPYCSDIKKMGLLSKEKLCK